MFGVGLFTQKLYYIDQYLASSHATIVEVCESSLVLDKTVLYPAGGGQESDRGWIKGAFGILCIERATLLQGKPIRLEGFNGGQSGGLIAHHVAQQDYAQLLLLTPGMAVTVEVEVERRQKLTLSHSASHFLYAAVLALRPELEANTIGCHIKENGARFDFITKTPFSPDNIQWIEQCANEWISSARPISIEVHPENADVRIWCYEDIRIPCGGTHLESPEDIVSIQVARKNLGKNKERLLCTFHNAHINVEKYHGKNAK